MPTTGFSSAAWHYARCAQGLTGIYKQQLAVDDLGVFKVHLAVPEGIYKVTFYFEACPLDTVGSRVFKTAFFDGRSAGTPAGAQLFDTLDLATIQNHLPEFFTVFAWAGTDGLTLTLERVNNAPLIAALAVIGVCTTTCLNP